jgi:hypothetical protein
MHDTQSFEMLDATNATTLLNIPEALAHQQHHCGKLTSSCHYFSL